MQDFIRNSNVRSLLTRWCLAVWVVTLIGVGSGVFVLVDNFFWRGSERQQLRAVTSLWQRRPLFMEGEYSLCPPPAKFELPPSRHVPNPLPFIEWGPLFAQAVAVTSDSCVRLYGPSGELLYASSDLPDVPVLSANQALASMVPEAPTRSEMVTGRHERFHVLCMPLVAEYHHITRGVLQVIKSSRKDDQNLRTLAGFVLLSGLVAVLIGYWMLVLLADALARPLELLMDTTKRVGGGDLDARTGLGSGTNEVFALASAFDRMAVQLKSSFAAQSRFVADASHELKTPLTTVTGMAEVLEMSYVGEDPQRRKALKTICREVDRMNGVISDLLTLSQLEEQAPEVGTSRVLLQNVIEELADGASMRDRTVQCDYSVGLLVIGSETRVCRIFSNLIDNALQYTPAEGTVTVRARQLSGRVLVEVSDTGAGISPEALPHVFERFYRADRSRCRKTGGTGLGLAIVHGLVQSLGGEVSIESQLGLGTRVTVILPSPG